MGTSTRTRNYKSTLAAICSLDRPALQDVRVRVRAHDTELIVHYEGELGWRARI